MSTASMDPNTLLALLYSTIILILIYTYFQRKPYQKLMDQFPAPVQLPLLGIFHRLTTPRKIILKFRQLRDIYKSETVAAFFGPIPGFHTIDPNLLEKILTHPNMYNKPDILYGALRDLFGDGIFTATRAKWQRNRKLISPAFRKPVLRTFVPVFNRKSGILKRKLDSMIEKGEQNILGIMQKFTLTVAMETVLGHESADDEELDDQVVQNYFTVLRAGIMMVVINCFNLSKIGKYFGFYKVRNAIFEFVTNLVEKRVKNNQSKTDINENTESKEAEFNESRNIFVDQALKSFDRKLFNWREVLDESNSIIFAAFETTATTLFYTFAFLAMHPEIQEKVFEHIKCLHPDKNEEVEFEHTDHYDYLDMVIYETLRHVPPVPAIARIVAEDTQLTEDVFLPKGVVVVINILETQQNPNTWGPDAHKYNPEHFSPENVSNRNPYAFLAFSRGLRNCIGGKYAMIAIKVVLIHILRNYRFTTKFKFEDLEFENNVIIRATEVPLLEVHKRED